MNESEIENECQEKNLDAPRITPKDIDDVIVDATYSILPSGTTIICELTLRNGFTVTGEASVISKENFDETVGKQIAYSKARSKVWKLEGYLLKSRIDKKCG